MSLLNRGMNSNEMAAASPFLLSRTGRQTRKHIGGPIVLNRRMLRMIDLMVQGHPDDPSRTPYGLYDAAAAVGYQRRAARALIQSALFLDAYYKALGAQNVQHLCPTLEQVREIAEESERKRARGRAGRGQDPGRIIRAPAPGPQATERSAP